MKNQWLGNYLVGFLQFDTVSFYSNKINKDTINHFEVHNSIIQLLHYKRLNGLSKTEIILNLYSLQPVKKISKIAMYAFLNQTLLFSVSYLWSNEMQYIGYLKRKIVLIFL